MTGTPFTLSRAEILAFRRAVGALDERLPRGSRSLRLAAWVGLQDSMPRAALLSIHARVAGTTPFALDDPSLVQLWGPRYNVYVVAAADLAPFSLGTLPDDAKGRRRAEDLAARLHTFLDGRTMTYAAAGHGLGVHPNSLRYAAATGTVLIRWEGARSSTVWTVPRPDVDPREARLELARRYIHAFGPTTPASFAKWAGISTRGGIEAFESLGTTLLPARSPIGDGWILAKDEQAFRATPRTSAPARFLPSGDPYFLLWGRDRDILVPHADRQAALWTTRVWPGALLADGEVVGTWRRAGPTVAIQAWRRLSKATRDAIEAEAASLPLPELEGRIGVTWET